MRFNPIHISDLKVFRNVREKIARYKNLRRDGMPVFVSLQAVLATLSLNSLSTNKRAVLYHQRICQKCGTDKNLTIDHIIPTSKGGSKMSTKNMRLLCTKCHVQITWEMFGYKYRADKMKTF